MFWFWCLDTCKWGQKVFFWKLHESWTLRFLENWHFRSKLSVRALFKILRRVSHLTLFLSSQWWSQHQVRGTQEIWVFYQMRFARNAHLNADLDTTINLYTGNVCWPLCIWMGASKEYSKEYYGQTNCDKLLKFLEHVDLVIFFTAVQFKKVSGRKFAKNLEKRTGRAWIWPKKSIFKKTQSSIFM